MKSNKYLFTIFTAAGLSLGALSWAEDPAPTVTDDSGSQRYCDLSDSTDELLVPVISPDSESSTTAADAFCLGLQSHGDINSEVKFGGMNEGSRITILIISFLDY